MVRLAVAAAVKVTGGRAEQAEVAGVVVMAVVATAAAAMVTQAVVRWAARPVANTEAAGCKVTVASAAVQVAAAALGGMVQTAVAG